VDEIYLKLSTYRNSVSASSQAADQLGNELREIDAKYSQMDYAGALDLALKAESSLPSTTQLTSPSANLRDLVVYVAVGIVIGVVLASTIAARRQRRSPRSDGE
jgi:subtilase family serine protease